MTKVFNFIYEKQRKTILYAMFSLFGITGILKGSTLTYISNFELVLDILNIFTVVVCLAYLGIDVIKRSLKVNIWGIALMGLMALTMLFSRHVLFFAISVFLCSFDKSDFENLTKVSFYSILLGFCLVVGMSMFGMIEDLTFNRFDVVRKTLGFHSSTQPQAIFMFLVLIGLYIQKLNVKVSTLLLEFVLAGLIYKLTDTRVGFYLSIAIILTALIIKLIDYIFKRCNKENKILNIFNNKLVRIFVISIPILLILLFGLLVYLYKFDLRFINELNLLLSNRIQLTFEAFKNHNITIFGDNINWFNKQGVYIGVDNSFFHYLFTYGLVGFVVSLIFNMLLLHLSLKTKNYWLLMCVLICLLDGWIEPYLLDIKYSVYIFMTSIYLVKERSVKEVYNGQKDCCSGGNIQS